MPGDHLAGSKDKITTITIDGLKVYVIEDLIIDRMAACSELRSDTDCNQAYYMLRYYQNRIDFKYLNEKAKQEELLTVLKRLRGG